MESWSYKDEDALYAASQPPTPAHLLALVDSLSIIITRRVSFVVESNLWMTL